MAVVLSHSDIAVPVGRLPAECWSRMGVAHRSYSNDPYLASEDAPVSCCWEVVKTHCQHRLVPAEEDLGEAC